MSGLIFVALALVWAVVLLPKALRHHDDLAQTRSVVDVSGSARVLARREAIDERKAQLVVNRAATAAAAEAPAATPDVLPADRVKARLAAQRRAAAVAAGRRRRILGVLLLADVAVGALAALGTVPVWAVSVPLVLTLSFLVTARLTVRRERLRHAAELRDPQDAAAPVTEAPDAVATDLPAIPEQRLPELGPDPAPAPAPASVRNEQGLEVVSGLDDTSAFPVGLLDAAAAVEPGALWDPLPVTLPTYVHKPRAQRSVRTIDLQAGDVVSSGHDAAASALVADAATSAPPDELPQRAVGS